MSTIWRLGIIFILLLMGCSRGPQKQTEASSPSAGNENYPRLTAQAKELETALASKDYAKVIDLTHPKVIEIGGGREKLLAEMTNEMKSMEAEGVELLSSTSATPSQLIRDASGIYAVVPVTTRIKAKDGVFQTEGSLIGVSTDGGLNWTFVDATGKDQTELKKILPNLDQLNVPPERPPVKIAS